MLYRGTEITVAKLLTFVQPSSRRMKRFQPMFTSRQQESFKFCYCFTCLVPQRRPCWQACKIDRCLEKKIKFCTDNPDDQTVRASDACCVFEEGSRISASEIFLPAGLSFILCVSLLESSEHAEWLCCRGLVRYEVDQWFLMS